MKIYTLMQTDTDIAYPVVGVHMTLEKAIATAHHDIQANGTEVLDQGNYLKDERMPWSILHRDPLTGQEHWSVIQEHEI